MGGKRDLQQGITLIDNDNKLNIREQLVPRMKPLQHHVTTFCPISIHIDECSDDERNVDTDTERDSGRHEDLSVTCPVSIQIDTCGDEGNIDETEQINISQSRGLDIHHLTNRTSVHKHTHSLSPVHNSHDTLQPSPSHSLRSSPNFLEVPEHSDLSMLKATAVRLKLRTRTSSFMAWKAKWMDKPRTPPEFPVLGQGAESDELTQERKSRIDHALQWLKTELREMQSMDQHLARQLLSLRHDIHQMRLSRSCQEHQDLLDDVQSEMEEQEELSDHLELPDTTLSGTPLKHIGVTRLNFSARRFSMC